MRYLWEMMPAAGTATVASALLLVASSLWGLGAGTQVERRNIAAIRGLEDAAISPNGDKVALYIVDPLYRDASGALVQSRLEIRDVASLKTDSIINLADSVLFSAMFLWSKPMPRVLYCDSGKYLFVYLGEGMSTVIETETGRTRIITPVEPPARRSLIRLTASCAGQADLLAIEVRSDRDGVNRVELFDLKEGKKVKEIPGGIARGQYVGLDVSASGDRVLTYMACQENTVCQRLPTDIDIFDTRSGAAVKTIDAGFPIGHAIFAGDSSIAAVSGDPKNPEVRRVRIFSVDTGQMTSEVGDRDDAPLAFTAASGNGHLLLAYTGNENRCEDCDLDNRGSLQIERAKFTIWDLTTGKVVARSPAIPARKIRGGILEDGKDLRANERPQFQFSASGTVVLVTNTREQSAVEVFLRKQNE